MALQAAILVVNMLRPLRDRAVAIRLTAANKTAEAVVLEQVACLFIRAVAIGQLRQLSFSVVGISNISTTSILFPYQSVKFVVEVGNGIIVAVGGGFQIAAGAGVFTSVVIIRVGRKRPIADLGCGGLAPFVVGKELPQYFSYTF